METDTTTPYIVGQAFAEQHNLTDSLEAVYATGYWLYQQERYEEAASVFRVLLQASPTEERSWLALADCHEKSGHWNIALELYGTGTVVAQPAPRCMLARARLLRIMERDVEAEEAYDEAEALADQVDDFCLKRTIRNERKLTS